ncbi:UNVERIFIED_CONTAM: hypothetical protein Sradi_3854000 [Sesamum radiatum]|uniref:Uncharacterized protein n=1 Tax=Sesamum radiatum TaxID=300843 RepID=A0AAW2Q256_SESRA
MTRAKDPRVSRLHPEGQQVPAEAEPGSLTRGLGLLVEGRKVGHSPEAVPQFVGQEKDMGMNLVNIPL